MISPAECARLYPLATKRELRMAQIEHELNLRALHALAFANEYPAKMLEPSPDAMSPGSNVLAFRPHASGSQR